MNYFKGRLILVLFCLLNPVIYGRPDVSSINQDSRTSLENNEYNSGLLAPPVSDKVDSYGKPISDTKKVVDAGGLQFQIPDYASGISGIRDSTDDLLPPIGDKKNPSSHVHQPSVDLLPPLPLNQDETLNEISYTTASTPVSSSTKFPNTSPVDKTLSTTVPTNVPFVKYTGGFGGAPGILGEQTEIGTWFKSMQDKTSDKNNEYSTTTPASTSTTRYTPTTPTTQATYNNDNKHFLPTPITELIAPPLPPSNPINEKPEQTPTSFPVRSNFDTNQKPFQQDFTSQRPFSTSTIVPQQKIPPAHTFPTSTFGSPPQNAAPAHNNFPSSTFGSPQQNIPPVHNFPSSTFGSPQQNTAPAHNFPSSTFGSPQQNTAPAHNFPSSTFGSPQQNAAPAHNFPTSTFGSPQQNPAPAHNFPTSTFGSPQQNSPPKQNFPSSTFGSPQQNTAPAHNFTTSTFGSPQQNIPPAHNNFPTSTFGSPQQNTAPAHNFPSSTFGSPQQSPHQAPSVGKYTGGFGGAPGVLGDQKKPGFAVQPDGSIKDPDHTYRPPTHANPITPTVPPQIPAQPAHSTTPIKYEKYTGGFGGPSGVLSPA